MCGIAGILGHSKHIKESTLEAMAQALAHRGPDDQGIELFKIGNNKDLYLGLVHRRLSIIDLSRAGHQPMSNSDSTIWITYNGEIYNYIEIHNELKAKGYIFKSHSDTEVIISAYQEWGIECLQRFRGMFAFALWDQRKKILFLAVDRFGIKPLYFYKGKEGLFLFSSEVRTILHSSLVEKEIEPLAVNSFLAYGAVQAPFTMIKGIYSLLPGQYLIYDFKYHNTHIVSYWSPTLALSDKPLVNKNKAIKKLRDILEDSIQQHLVSDVPVGLFLSGGIDSSSVVALANKLKEGSLQTFSVTFPELLFSEGKYSRLIAKRYSRNHTEIKISENDLLNFLPQALGAMDQPTINGINAYAISSVVRSRGIKVVLSGQGGDEVFGGYSTFKRIPTIQRMYNLVRPLPLSIREKVGRVVDGFMNRDVIKSKISQILESEGDVFFLYLILRQLFSPKARRYLMKDGNGGTTVNGIPLVVVESLTSEIKQLDLFSKISLLELRLYLANMLLRDGDFMCMAHGLEVRVPFLDHKLVEFVFNISSKMKLRNNLPKPLLVKAMGNLLPKEIYMRPKMGFTFPWEFWLRNKLRPQVEEVLNNFPVNNGMGLNIKECQNLWSMFLQSKSGVTWSRAWAIYVLLSWVRRNALG